MFFGKTLIPFFFLYVSRRFVFLKRQRRRAEKFTHLFTYSSAFVEARMFIRAFFCLGRRLPHSHARAYLFKRCPFCVQTLLADSSVCFSSPPAARRSSVASSQLPAKIPMLPFPFPTGKAANDLVYSPARENIKSPSDRDLAWEDFFFAVGAAAVAASAVDLHSAERKNVSSRYDVNGRQ